MNEMTKTNWKEGRLLLIAFACIELVLLNIYFLEDAIGRTRINYSEILFTAILDLIGIFSMVYHYKKSTEQIELSKQLDNNLDSDFVQPEKKNKVIWLIYRVANVLFGVFNFLLFIFIISEFKLSMFASNWSEITIFGLLKMLLFISNAVVSIYIVIGGFYRHVKYG
jgi:uncharacterized protein YqhQ